MPTKPQLIRPFRWAALSLVAVTAFTYALIARSPEGEMSAAGNPVDLRICVDSFATNVDLNQVRTRLERVLRSHVQHHERFAVAGYDAQRSWIVEGCPAGPALLLAGERHPKNGGRPTLSGLVSTPSGFRVFVFVVQPAEVDRMFGVLPFQHATQELVCEGDSCRVIAVAWYVSLGTLGQYANPGSDNPVARALSLALGLEPPVPHEVRTGPQSK